MCPATIGLQIRGVREIGIRMTTTAPIIPFDKDFSVQISLRRCHTSEGLTGPINPQGIVMKGKIRLEPEKYGQDNLWKV